MTTTVPVNGRRLRAAIEDQLIAERTFARSTNLGDRSLRTMLNENKLFGSLTVSEVDRIANEAGLTLLELLTPDQPTIDTQPEPQDLPNADVRVLNQLLRAADTRTPLHTIAIALGWKAARLNHAVQALNTYLQPLGEHAHENSQGLKVLPLDEGAANATTRMLTIRDADLGINANTARLLYAVYRGTLSGKKVSKTNIKHLTSLTARGLVQRVDKPGDRIHLADKVRFAFE